MAAKRFSPSAAWDDVRATLAAHSQLLIALGGAFFLLPLLALSFFGPANMVVALGENPSGEQVWAAFRPLVPWLLLFAIVQMAGQLAILSAILRRGGATVAEGVVHGLGRLGYLILANLVFLLLAMAAMILLVIVFGLLAMVAGPLANALALVGGIAAVAVYFVLYVRFLLLPVLLVAEDIRWPLALLGRSWQLTRGNTFPIFAFYLIVTIVFIVIVLTVTVIFGPLLTLLGLDMTPGGAGAAILAVVNGVVSTAGTVIFLLMQLAVYRLVGGATPRPA